MHMLGQEESNRMYTGSVHKPFSWSLLSLSSVNLIIIIIIIIIIIRSWAQDSSLFRWKGGCYIVTLWTKLFWTCWKVWMAWSWSPFMDFGKLSISFFAFKVPTCQKEITIVIVYFPTTHTHWVLITTKNMNSIKCQENWIIEAYHNQMTNDFY